MQNFRALGAPPPEHRASGGWGLCPQTPSLRQLGASPPDPPNSPPIANFWLRACICKLLDVNNILTILRKAVPLNAINSISQHFYNTSVCTLKATFL